ncbi:hypothetical protein CPB97_005851 [Podila verticillata]|nr:hypothetical protein CPB97_005851 [Podila verticillata]
MSSMLPSRFLRLTGAKNKLIRQFEALRTDRRERQTQGHVLVQGLKTIQELAAKGHRIRTVGITFDEHNLPVRQPALSIIKYWEKYAEVATESMDMEQVHRTGAMKEKEIFRAGQFVAVSRAMTTRILGTDSKTSEHEVWAEVRIPDHQALFSASDASANTARDGQQGTRDFRRMLILDQITDPGNTGLMVRAGMAMGWDGVWSTPGTVDMYNDKVVRASRAHCLEWPNHLGDWAELASFLERRKMSLVVADMLPMSSTKSASVSGGSDSTLQQDGGGMGADLDCRQLVWWNWPASLPRTSLPERLALVMSSEHHGVKGRRISFSDQGTKKDMEQDHKQDQQSGKTQIWDREQKAKAHLLKNAIRVSIPMHPAVESLNVATAAAIMMWEMNSERHPKLQVLDL